MAPHQRDTLVHRIEAAGATDDDLGQAQLVARLEREVLGRAGAAVRLSRYLLLERVGEGGLGVVHAAYDPQLDRKVALKLLHPRATFTVTGSASSRLLREARAMARLSHPNVVPVHDVGVSGQRVFMVMELVHGLNLRDWLAARTREWSDVLDIFMQAGQGLAAAHREGIVHRDFKPGNVLVSADGEAKVTDFGLARATDRTTPEVGPLDCSSLSLEVTRPGVVMGTPRYMAPEQERGAPVDARADQYAFFVALYEGLYGQPPFRGESAAGLLRKKLRGLPAEPPHRRVPRRLYQAIRRGLACDPEARFPGMDEALAALDLPRLGRRRAVLGAGAVVLVGCLAATVVHAETATRCPGEGEVLWDDGDRDEVRRAFSATDVPYAGEAWASVDRTLEGYAAQWSSTHARACAEESREDMARRLTCLDTARARFDELARLFTDADARTVEGAVGAVVALPDPQRCFAAPEGGPLPAAMLAGERQMHAALARAHAMHTAGRLAEATAAAKEAVQEAHELGRPEVEASMLLELAQFESAMSAVAEAMAHLEEALVLAEEAGAPEPALRALIELVEAARRLAKYEQAELFARQARARLAHLGPDPTKEADLLTHLGMLRSSQGEFDEAKALQRRALDQRIETLGQMHPAVATSWERFGYALMRRGEYDEAIAAYGRALSIRTSVFGPAHPSVATPLGQMAVVAAMTADYATGHDRARRAVEILEAALGPENPRTAQYRLSLAAMQSYRLDYEGALASVEEAAGVLEAHLGPEHPEVGHAWALRAFLLYSLGHTQASLRAYERSRELTVARFGADHPNMVGILTGIAYIHARTGREEEAVELAERALAIAERRHGSQHLSTAYPLTVLGEARLRLGDAPAALPVLERAHAIRDGAPIDPANRAETDFALARARHATGGEPGAAVALAREARAAFVTTGRRSAAEVEAVDAWLGRVSAGPELRPPPLPSPG